MAPVGPAMRWTAIALAASTLACNPFAQPGTAPRRPPVLRIDAPSMDLGAVRQGTPVAHAFTVQNVGDLTLTLDGLRTACDCVARAAATPVVRPGQSTTITVECTTTGILGPTSRTVTVYANDPAQPVTTLTLTAIVTDGVAADPREAYVGALHRGLEAPREVRLLADPQALLAQVTVERAGPVIDARLLRTGDTVAALGIWIRPDAPLGAFRETVRVRFGSPTGAALDLPVVGIVADTPAPEPHR